MRQRLLLTEGTDVILATSATQISSNLGAGGAARPLASHSAISRWCFSRLSETS